MALDNKIVPCKFGNYNQLVTNQEQANRTEQRERNKNFVNRLENLRHHDFIEDVPCEFG